MEIKEGYIYIIHGDWEDSKVLSVEVIKDRGDGVLNVSVKEKENWDIFPKELLQEWLEKYDYDVKKAEDVKIDAEKEVVSKEVKNDAPKKSYYDVFSTIVGLAIVAAILYGIGSCTWSIFKKKVNPEPKIHIVHKREQPSKTEKPTKRELTQEEKDSLHRVWAEREQWEKDNTIVIICDVDSIYHTTTICDSLSALFPIIGEPHKIDINKYRLSTESHSEKNNYKKCESCMDVESAYFDYENGDLIDRYDADEYCSHSDD